MLKAYNIDKEIVVNKFDLKEIKYAFHDIDGTHSLIRDWPPVMSICLSFPEDGVLHLKKAVWMQHSLMVYEM